MRVFERIEHEEAQMRPNDVSLFIRVADGADTWWLVMRTSPVYGVDSRRRSQVFAASTSDDSPHLGRWSTGEHILEVKSYPRLAANGGRLRQTSTMYCSCKWQINNIGLGGAQKHFEV